MHQQNVYRRRAHERFKGSSSSSTGSSALSSFSRVSSEAIISAEVKRKKVVTSPSMLALAKKEVGAVDVTTKVDSTTSSQFLEDGSHSNVRKLSSGPPAPLSSTSRSSNASAADHNPKVSAGGLAENNLGEKLRLPKITTTRNPHSHIASTLGTAESTLKQGKSGQSSTSSSRPGSGSTRAKKVEKLTSQAARRDGHVGVKSARISREPSMNARSPVPAVFERTASQASVFSKREDVQDDESLDKTVSKAAVKTADLNGRISIDLMLSKNIINSEELSHDEALDYLSHLSHIRLDRCEIRFIDGLSNITSITHLYLQHNMISMIENLSELTNLRFLALSDNKICTVSGLKGLTKLKFIDLARNLIVDVKPDELPKSLQYVIFAENPVTLSPDYRLKLIADLPNIFEIDEVKITKQERNLAKNVFELSSESDLDASDDDDSADEKPTSDQLIIAKDVSPIFVKQSSEVTLFEHEISSPFSKTVQDLIARSKERQQKITTDYSSRLSDIKAKLKESSRRRVEEIRKRIHDLELDGDID